MTVELEEGSRWQRLQPRERALIILFGIIAILAVVYLLFLSGGGEEPEAFPTPRRTTPRATATPTVVPTASPTGIPETIDFFEGKDPFRPLVTAGGIGGTPAPQPGGSPGPSGGPSGGDAQRVTLVSISGSGSSRTATVLVDGQEYTVSEGETFAGSYRVKSLTADCGTFVFGDEQFTLCEGQEVLK